MKKLSTVDRFAEATRENHATRDSCQLHKFNPAEYKHGKSPVCLNCGAWVSAQRVYGYIEGYAAHGGDVNDIWPGYNGSLACV